MKCCEDNLKWYSLENVQKFFKAPVKDSHNYSNLNKKIKDMFCHVDCHANELASFGADWRFDKRRDHLSIFPFKVPAPVLGTSMGTIFILFFNVLKKREMG